MGRMRATAGTVVGDAAGGKGTGHAAEAGAGRTLKDLDPNFMPDVLTEDLEGVRYRLGRQTQEVHPPYCARAYPGT